MSIMLNESNSSFDTTPSFDFVMRHEDGRDDEVMASDIEDEEEGYDLIDGGNERREDIGVLIVPPTTGSSGDSHNTILSVPDSVPTVMNSAMLDVPDCVHVVDSAQPTPVRSNATQVSTNEVLNRELVSLESKNESIVASQNAWRRNILALLFFAAVSTGSVCHAFYLHRESLLLKEQVRLLTDQAARSAATLDELKQKQAREVVLDNCWLQAHAKMSFGECSQEATETVKETVNTFGSSVHNFWEHMKEAYQENLKGSASAFGGFNHSFSANTTENVFSTRVNAIFNRFSKIKTGRITEKVNMMGSSIQDVWNQTKGVFNSVNVTEPMKTFGNGLFRVWVDVKVIIKEKMEDQVYDVGRSFYEAPSMLFNILKGGYNDLKDTVRESILYMNSDTAESNTTSADDTAEPHLPDHLLQNNNGNALQSISKKVLVAAAWSAGAAILVSTFDMYWNQHGNFPALEN